MLQGATLAAVLGAVLALAAGKLISELVDRARPFVEDPHGVHFPSDVLAGAALGAAAALALWWAPLRSRVDALADVLGRPVDRALESGARLVWGRGRS